jgi:alpha,alpha-trehalase
MSGFSDVGFHDTQPSAPTSFARRNIVSLMRLRHCLVALLLTTAATAQQPIPIDTYIHQSWDHLQRSMTDCASFPDVKAPTNNSQPNAPILYLPEEQKLTPELRALQQHCSIRILHLPHRIHNLGDVDPAALPNPGLLYLPNPYVVPGGRFNEMYGWDSYFILLGELADNRVALARGTVENFFYEIDHYGAVLNANRTYYLTRSQPPFLSSMVLAVYNAELPADPKQAHDFLRESLPYLLRDHKLWVTAPHLDPATGLSRYVDLGQGPVPEMSDDSTYYPTVIHWLLAHPSAANATYLQPSPACITTTCPQPHADNYALTPSFYQGDRAMRESGFDTTFRFGPYSGSTQDFAPIDLNALLYKYERDIAFIQATLSNPADAIVWSTTAGDRLHAIDSLLWDDASGLYYDFNLRTHQRSTYRYLTTYYALWAGVASPAKAARMAAALPLFDRPGGLATSTFTSGEQWDQPYGWAPTNWLAITGLIHYGYIGDGLTIARHFTATIATNYANDGTLREKYNVVDSSANIAISAGYKENVIGFGWTNAVYAAMQQLLHDPKLLNAPQQPPPPSQQAEQPPASPPSQNQ